MWNFAYRLSSFPLFWILTTGVPRLHVFFCDNIVWIECRRWPNFFIINCIRLLYFIIFRIVQNIRLISSKESYFVSCMNRFHSEFWRTHFHSQYNANASDWEYIYIYLKKRNVQGVEIHCLVDDPCKMKSKISREARV